MGEKDSYQRSLKITVNLNGKDETLQVSPEDTTDGIEYFKCNLEGKNITQIRREEDGNWEQIWGELDNKTVEEIGKAITAAL